MMQEREHHVEDEVRRALSRLRRENILRLTGLARTWIGLAPRRDAQDLLAEALDRMLSGRRPWPVGLPLPSFLSGVMRSIADEWGKADARQPLIADRGQDEAEVAASADPAGDNGELFDEMRLQLAADDDGRGVFDHMRLGTYRAEAKAALGMDDTRYDTARRRMLRNLLKAFGPGWNK